MEEAKDATTIAESYGAIELALGLLGDSHSFLVVPSGDVIKNSSLDCSGPGLVRPELDNRVGYLHIPAFAGSGSGARQFARELQAEIRESDHDSLRGWIVDLRGNGGEAIAIAFKERTQTRSFGQLSCGISTGNESWKIKLVSPTQFLIKLGADHLRVTANKIQ